MGETATPSTPPSGDPVKQPLRSRAGGIALMVTAVLLVALSAAFTYHDFTVETGEHDVHNPNIGLLVYAVIAAIGLFSVARKLLTSDARALLARDHRDPVVFLRPFFEDKRRQHAQPVGVRRGGKGIANPSSHVSLETSIARPLTSIGPFVSVGAPGDKLAPLGSARMYLSDDQWQAEVEALVRRAAAVVLQPDVTAGTRWELGKVAQWVDPRRLLVLVPNPEVRPLGYGRVRALTAGTFAMPLPEECPPANAFIFDERGRPTAVLLGKNISAALQPFIEQVRGLPSREEATS